MNSKRRELYIFLFAAIPILLFLYMVRRWSQAGEPTVAVPGLPSLHIPWPVWITENIPDPQRWVPAAFSSPQAKVIAIAAIIVATITVIVILFLLMDLVGKLWAATAGDAPKVEPKPAVPARRRARARR